VNRRWQVALVASTCVFSWLAMQVVHELGHVLFAWASGGSVARVSLPPLGFSRTELGANPHPLAVAWGGAIGGVALPLVALATARLARLRAKPFVRFFAGFCLIANGIYLGAGPWTMAGDASDLIVAGAPGWMLVVFGTAAMPAGFLLWNGLGPSFGFGEAKGAVDRRLAVGVTCAAVAIVAFDIAWSSWKLSH
jgi:hypothetical protein